MAVKIKTKVSFGRLLKMLPDARSKFAKEMRNSISDVIIRQMEKGLSPVEGFGRYKKKANGEQSTLFKDGPLYESVKTQQKGFTQPRVTISVGSRKVPYAQYHQYGTENLDARPILPTRGLKFKKVIMNRIFNVAVKAVKDSTKKVRG